MPLPRSPIQNNKINQYFSSPGASAPQSRKRQHESGGDPETEVASVKMPRNNDCQDLKEMLDLLLKGQAEMKKGQDEMKKGQEEAKIILQTLTDDIVQIKEQVSTNK